jgi:NAD(P)-dependent dehydrogenase (short-subunit alcohol dehydrogenase family)
MKLLQKHWKLLGTLALLGVGREIIKRENMLPLTDKVVLITGGSRGLGLATAYEFALEGARLVLCARDEEELRIARMQLTEQGAQVLTIPCDIADPEQVQQAVEQATAQWGQIDILINNAGIISNGSWSTFTRQDFEESMNIMFWGMYNMTMATLPQMVERHHGNIVNITSVGGKVSVPHLLPYSSAKFAAVGFSEGLQTELRKEGIRVTTVAPGLMRTGSAINTIIKGEHHQEEYTLFKLLDTLPATSISVQRAARQIVQATRRGQAELIISIQAQILTRLHGAFPEITTAMFSFINRFLPTSEGTQAYSGQESETKITRSTLTALGQKAERKYNEQPESPGE